MSHNSKLIPQVVLTGNLSGGENNVRRNDLSIFISLVGCLVAAVGDSNLRCEMFDLSRSFLAQIAAEQKKVWFLYGFSVMFIGGIYRIKRNWKDTTTKNGSFIIY